ncbi:E3 ubiquitin-protein ligase RNF216 [Cryptococcus gattii EJB2]|uniref:E3 ubiquitin-protein ligase RNF216 n=1 Tax=Cryptococcus gattii EJB2 TaxID=1296103 RepID=A0ABR5BM74_9TREE|nr:E3 ubiquitin-protein ligase RNF216 [Cryptococcus gattii EJB2]
MHPPTRSHPRTPHTASSTKHKQKIPHNSSESDSDTSVQALEQPPKHVRGRKNAPIIIDDSDSERDAPRPAKRLRIEVTRPSISESIPRPSARPAPLLHRNASSHAQIDRAFGFPSAAGPSRIPSVGLTNQSGQPVAGPSRSYASTTSVSPASIRRTKSNEKVRKSPLKTSLNKLSAPRAPVLPETLQPAHVPWSSSGPIQHGTPAGSPALLGLPPVEYLDDEAFFTPPNQISTPSSSPSAKVVLPPLDPIHADAILQNALEILPDLEPEWASAEIAKHLASGHTNRLAEIIVDRALEVEGGYPKAIGKAKEKKKEEEPEDGYKLNTYRHAQRSGPQYYALATQYLEAEFPLMPTAYIRSTFVKTCGSLFSPAYYRLLEDIQANPRPYVELQKPRKSKGIALMSGISLAGDGGEAEFERELAWLEERLVKENAEKEEAERKRKILDEAIASGYGIECGCCFGDEILENMFQCAEGHLFCKECTMRNAEMKLGEQQITITCMDLSGCRAPFPESELGRALSEKTLSLYHRLKQARELELAAIEGLESCPSCPYSAIIENPDEKLFRCMNETCGQVTCRKCRRKEHIPKTCEEMDKERTLNRRHAVEDAMSAALIRNCPKCTKPFVKDSGCNKIICTTCRTMSCYVCRKIITGYEHFDRQTSNCTAARDKGKCRLWDSEANPDEKAIRAARDAAAAEAMAAAAAEGAQVNAEELDIDMPEALPTNLPGANHLAAPLPNHLVIQPILPLYDRLRQLGQERVDRVDQMPAAQQHANVALNIHNGHIRQHEENIARMVNADLARARPDALVVPAAGAAVDPAASLIARSAAQSARRVGGGR